ncbi:MAG: hypothetical protein OSB69_05025, partial [Alphaproteobacteria bacterium]|nr:hypothetical protein [Alphaproteobacteria bacterium]
QSGGGDRPGGAGDGGILNKGATFHLISPPSMRLEQRIFSRATGREATSLGGSAHPEHDTAKELKRR